MKIVLLAGGLGSRLSEETVRIPKPMVEVGGRPILLHVMETYRHFGFQEFIVAGGYKCLAIKRFFNDFQLVTNDITISFADGRRTMRRCQDNDLTVSVVDTGELTMTAGRLLRLRDWIGQETFMVTYSDGVGNIDVEALLRFHRRHGRLATVTAVQPPARFGNLELSGDRVSEFTEKVRKHETWINGGFFVFEPGVFDYLVGDAEPLERRPLSQLSVDGELFAYKHFGFWHPMDTVRDRDYLQSLSAAPPWLDFTRSEAEALPAL
jgi:glucose-1-phosphate cytidylyltransferase